MRDGAGLHVAIIMDGNGRWAASRGLPRLAGHREGCRALRRVVEAAPGLGIAILTLYAFSSDNWERPPGEVRGLLELFEHYLKTAPRSCLKHGVRLNVIGRRDRLPSRIVRAIRTAERRTAAGRALHVRLAIDYSARHAITVAAAGAPAGAPLPFARFAERLQQGIHSQPSLPDVDLLVRTGGEQRLSDFLLWECAYAELVFTRRPWPEYGAPELRAALDEFRGRDRRFGRVSVRGAGS